MIPILYRNDELLFTSNGVGRLTDCISCTVTEERNGIYECEFEYPITGKYYSEMVEHGGIISVIHDDTKTRQPFDIYAHTDPIDGIVTFNAHHISYRLNRCLVGPFNAASAAEVMAEIPNHLLTDCRFTFWTDKATLGSFKLTHPSNIREFLAGSEGSILDVYGSGDYEFDKYAVKLHTNRGVNTDVTIRYGKNLSDLTNEYDDSESFSAVLPYWVDADGTVVRGNIVRSTTLRASDNPWTDENMVELEDGNGNVIYFQYPVVTPVAIDFTEDFEDQPTVAQLNARAQAFMNSNQSWLPYQNLTIDFVQLWQTPEYESVAALQRVSLCDLVSVYYPEMNIIQSSQKVIRVVYNVLLERYDSMELGQAKTTFAETVYGSLASDIQAVMETQRNYIEQRASILENLIETQTELITGGLGGYVVMNLNASGQPQEILIMDTDDINTAVNVIRLNKNGIGFSTTGYAGPYASAWTIDGSFNADFISAGSISANLIQSGTMSANLIRGGILLVGGANNTNGIFRVQNAGGTTIVEANKDGLTVNDGVIQGPDIIVGGLSNANGTLTVKDASGTTITTLDKDGINTTSLTASSYIYMDTTNTSSKLKMPMGNKVNSYFEISSSKVFYLQSYWTSTYTYIQILEQGLKYWNSYSSSYTVLGDNGVEISDAEYNGMRLAFQVHNTANTKRFIATDEGYSTTGSKSREIDSDQFGTNRFFCYETPTPVFGDIGEGVIDQDGFCIVDLDPILSSSILPKGYQVFLQKYGSGDCWVAERKPDYFVVEGTPGLSFGWELKAKQVGYDQVRYNDPTQFGSEENPTYESSIFDYMEEIIERSYAA